MVYTSRPLKLLHTDLFGHVSTGSINRKKYRLVIADHYSIWTWVKFLRTKDESYDVFGFFWIQVQTEKESKYLKVRSDYDGEFENEPFELFCKKHGTLHDLYSPRTQQKN